MNGQEVVSQFAAAAIVVYLLQFLKVCKYVPWVTADSKYLNRALAFLGALVSALGVHAAFDSTTGVLTVTGLTAVSMMHGAWEAAKAFAFQQVIYDAAVAPKVTVLPTPSTPGTLGR